MSGVRLSDVKLWTADQKIAQRFPGLRNQFSASLFALLTGVSAMSQAQSSLEDLQKRKAIAEAEKAMIDAEFARDEAKKKLTDSQVPIDPAKTAKDAKVDAAKSAKDIADAEKAEADAKLAALKAKIGEVPASGISGNVTLIIKAPLHLKPHCSLREPLSLRVRKSQKLSLRLCPLLQTQSCLFSLPVRFLIFRQRQGFLPSVQSCCRH